MLKLVKEKMLVSLVVVMLVALVFGSINSMATTITPKPSNTASSSNTANKAVGASVSTSNKTGNNAVNNTNKATNTNKTNTSNYKNTNSANKLPYAGTNSSTGFVVVALIASALYAYKKVSDYNI